MPRAALNELQRERMTPFGQIIYDYLLSFRPTRLVAELARESGIADQTIWSWLRDNKTPRRATVMHLAKHVPALPLTDMLKAAGHPLSRESQDREEKRREAEEVMNFISQWIHTSIGGEAAQRFDDYLEDALREYAGADAVLRRGEDEPAEEDEEAAKEPEVRRLLRSERVRD